MEHQLKVGDRVMFRPYPHDIETLTELWKRLKKVESRRPKRGGVIMAHFYADIRGNRGEATRMGSKESGITGHIRGWDIGARVSCYHQGGEDFVRVTLTRGSNGFGNGVNLGTFRVIGDELVKVDD